MFFLAVVCHTAQVACPPNGIRLKREIRVCLFKHAFTICNALVMISGPMPSPARTTIFFFLHLFSPRFFKAALACTCRLLQKLAKNHHQNQTPIPTDLSVSSCLCASKFDSYMNFCLRIFSTRKTPP